LRRVLSHDGYRLEPPSSRIKLYPGEKRKVSTPQRTSLLSSVQDYFSKIRRFSRNARLLLSASVLHGLAFGIWGVIFNLYLLGLGFQEDFIGFLLLLGGITYGLAAFAAGIVCDRIGRRTSFLVGATTAAIFNFIQVFTSDPVVLLSSSFLGGLLGPLSWVAEAPFMMENSEPEERTHLFSVSFTIFLVFSMIGNLLGGNLPRVLGGLLGVSSESALAFRATLVFSIGFLLVALLPYYMIKERREQRSKERAVSGFSLKNIRSRLVIGKLVLTAGLIGLGAGFIVPLFNVFFVRKLASTPEQVGLIFALGDVTVAVGTLLAPVVSSKLGKVRAVAFTELISIPFILGIAFSPNLGFAAISYLARGSLMNMAGPLRNNFSMEVVLEGERATTSGLTIMADGIPRAISGGLAGQIMKEGNYVLPYFATSVIYFAASSLFLTFFRRTEKKR